MTWGLGFWLRLFLFGAVCTGASAAEVLVGSAVSLRAPMEELSLRFEATHPGTHVRWTFGSSSNLARQIQFGGPIDVFVSADERWVERLISLSLVDASDHFRIASNRLVVVTRRGAGLEINSPADLAGAEIDPIAVPPVAVPLGRYARAWLDHKGLAETLESRTVVTEHARATLAAVEHGYADAAIVYETDANQSSRVEVAYRIPISEHPEIIYSAALLRNAKQDRSARQFHEYVGSPEAKSILRRAGFSPFAPAGSQEAPTDGSP
ncbi:MAG: molybdate ABC transporter substrate-binding protein [Myxococcota bacterium]